MTMLRNATILILLSILAVWQQAEGRSDNPKREFRGAWMSTVFQDQYQRQSTEENKRYICGLLDKMKAAGINAVLFQARPSTDAFYASKYENWSIFLTANQKAPEPYWDPLEFVIYEAHKRGMELHAWLNPYRVTTSKTHTLPKGHLYHREPDRFIRYEGDGKIYLDPGQPQNRAYLVEVITDIIDRYNIDGIHFDDYFYPYPANGKDFGDDKSYALYGNGLNKADWRRQNVNKLIEEIHYMISHSKKPWVRFGISPFGIWRNAKTDPRGSDTNGLQAYDELYADVLLWAEKGWIDYVIPQLYWELEHKRASSLKLVDWWSKAVSPNCQLYIGQDVERTMATPDISPSKAKDQLTHKINLTRADPNILGNCWWPCYSVASDFKGVATALSKGAHSSPAIVPAYDGLYSDKPARVTDLSIKDGILTWKCGKIEGKSGDPVKFVIYRFDSPDKVDFEDAAAIVDIIPSRHIAIDRPGIYGVTALDRVNNESQPSKTIVYR